MPGEIPHHAAACKRKNILNVEHCVSLHNFHCIISGMNSILASSGTEVFEGEPIARVSGNSNNQIYTKNLEKGYHEAYDQFVNQKKIDNIYLNYTNQINPNTSNETIIGLEAGYVYEVPNFSARVDLYRTSWADRVTSSFYVDDDVVARACHTTKTPWLRCGAQVRCCDVMRVHWHACTWCWHDVVVCRVLVPCYVLNC